MTIHSIHSQAVDDIIPGIRYGDIHSVKPVLFSPSIDAFDLVIPVIR